MFIAALFTITKCWKQPKCPSVNLWIKKLWYVYTMEYYAIERKKRLPFVTALMELESIMLNKIGQTLKDKYHMVSPVSGIWWAKQTNEPNRTTGMETWSRLKVTRVKREGDCGGKKGKGPEKEHVWMTHGHGH